MINRLSTYIFTSLIALFVAVGILIPAVNAQQTTDICTGKASDSLFCQTQNPPGDPINDEGGVIYKLIDFFTTMVLVVSVFAVIVGGYRITFSAGEANSVTAGRNTVVYAVIGLVIAIFAKFIVAFALGRL